MGRLSKLVESISNKWSSEKETPVIPIINSSMERIFKTPEELDILDGWNKFDQNNPPYGSVLVACDTYDCGWQLDTAWWNPDKSCWMATGPIKSTRCHLPYSHWKNLPDPPNERKEY